jgi:Lipid A 3-O-deacylase (PagL)
VPLNQCPFDHTHARECRVHVRDLVIEASTFLAFQNAGNLYTSYWYRYETTTGKWWDRYVNSFEGWRWGQWHDGNPFLDDYIGHGIMGSITNNLWIQNDPKGMTLEQSNSWPYWRSRLRALAFSTFYSFEWKMGPIGEASIGHNGDHYFTDAGQRTNDTGDVELVSTPLGGLGWTLAEDALDKHVVKRLEAKSSNPLLLTVYQFLTPSKGFDNVLRFRPPWYRDSRVVKANGFWTDPTEGVSATTAEAMKRAKSDPRAAGYLRESGELAAIEPPLVPHTAWEGPGGKHEFGATWGLSLMSGHLWGFAPDVKYMPITLRYSYELYRHHEAWTFRYAPELTALAMIDWPTPQKIGRGHPGTVFNQRERIYGSGLSPVGLELDARPLSGFQPYFRGNGGFIYFGDKVLSAQGSQFMYTIGPDVGFNIYRHKRQAISVGWRYTHLSNANISVHNPGTDANIFYVGISRFRNKGE